MNVHPRQHVYYLEDFTPGAVYETPSTTVTREQLIEFAKQYDPQPYHLDDEAARRSVFGSIAAGGFQIAALAWALGLRTGLFDHCAMAGLGIDELRWLLPLKPGDTVKCIMEIIDTRPSRSKSDRGAVTIRYNMVNQNNETIMTLKLIQMLQRRPANGNVSNA